MTFFKNIKRSLGFSDSDEVFDEGIDATVKKKDVKTSEIYVPEASIEYEIKPQFSISEKPEEKLEKMQLQIFDGVVKLFNDSLPDFLKTCLDTDAQRKYIYDSLDQSLRDYINNISTEARVICESQWDKERSRLIGEMRTLKAQYKDLESAREEWKRQQLSAERQKRALSTRVHDLEAQVVTLEAEKEQYDLENKSLINKLKVSNINDSNVDALNDEISRLQGLLKEARNTAINNSLGTSSIDYDKLMQDKDQEISILKDKIEQISGQLSLQNDSNLHFEEVIAENERLKDSIEKMKVKENISDSMINDLNENASAALKSLEEKGTEIESLSLELQNKVTENDDLKAELEDIRLKYDAALGELNEIKESLTLIDSIQAEITQFEQIKANKDAKINELQQELSQDKNRIVELENDIESLKSTIENNLYNQAVSEKKLLEEIEKLKKRPKGKSVKEKSDASPVKISAIDPSIDDADWLISIPPEDTSIRATQQGGDKEFGYQEPSRKKTPENEAQMSLW